jgi:hypothetical protein
VDIKQEGAASYAALKQEMRSFLPMLTRFRGGKIEPGAVTILLSGDRPRTVLEAEHDRYAALDGRPQDLGKGVSVALMPLISTSWFGMIRWFGSGTMPPEERQKLDGVVAQAHEEGRRFRFWAAPDTPSGWEIQRRARVDWINTDKLSECRTWWNAKS